MLLAASCEASRDARARKQAFSKAPPSSAERSKEKALDCSLPLTFEAMVLVEMLLKSTDEVSDSDEARPYKLLQLVQKSES